MTKFDRCLRRVHIAVELQAAVSLVAEVSKPMASILKIFLAECLAVAAVVAIARVEVMTSKPASRFHSRMLFKA
jgi:hypothetical protein